MGSVEISMTYICRSWSIMFFFFFYFRVFLLCRNCGL